MRASCVLKKPLLDFVFSQMGCGTFFVTLELSVALPDHPAVLAGRIPHLEAVETATITTGQSGSKQTVSTVPTAFALAPSNLGLHQIPLVWADDVGIAV